MKIKNLEEEQKEGLFRILLSALLLSVGAGLLWGGILPDVWYISLPCFLIPYAIVGWEVWKKAILGIGHGQFLDETFLMVIATVGAMIISEYPEAVLVMLLYQIGEWLEDLAVDKSRDSIASLMELRPDTARVLRNGKETVCPPEEVAVGEEILVYPGERIPLDGVVLEGKSSLDTLSLTGEALPKDTEEGDSVLSGCVSLKGILRIRVEKSSKESTVTKILDLVENSSLAKSKTEQTVSKFARIYTPCVVFGAIFFAVIPSLFTHAWEIWIYRALNFLVISCPCALVISIPLSYFSGLGAVSKKGVLVKGANILEALAKVDTVVFDKTGTLTKGKFRVVEVMPTSEYKKEEILSLAGSAERFSSHPIAKAICEAGGREESVRDVEEDVGFGVRANAGGKELLVGNAKLMQKNGVKIPVETDGKTVVYVAVDKNLSGIISLSDTVKEETPDALSELRRLGVKRIEMLSGDRPEAAKEVAETLGLDAFHAGLLPGGKVEKLEEIMKREGGVTCFVGDGVNDAPVLARADIGIAMGALGSDAAMEASDVVLMDDSLSGIAKGIAVSKKTKKIARENICFALGVKFLFLALSVLGVANLWLATFADVGVALLAVLNAMRAGRAKNI